MTFLNLSESYGDGILNRTNAPGTYLTTLMCTKKKAAKRTTLNVSSSIIVLSVT